MKQMKETLGISDNYTNDESHVFKPLMPVVVIKHSGRCIGK